MNKYSVHGYAGIVIVEAASADEASDLYTQKLGSAVYFVCIV